MQREWPNNRTWCARRKGSVSLDRSRSWSLAVVACGELSLPTGRLVACDPFAAMRQRGNAEVSVPKGRFPVFVTVADVSEQQDGSHTREAYASVGFREEPESERRLLVPLAPG